MMFTWQVYSPGFKLSAGTYWAFQHDVRVQAHNDRYITLFDNESGVYRVRRQSGGVKLRLDLKHMAATQVHRDSHAPPALVPFAGITLLLESAIDHLPWHWRCSHGQPEHGISIRGVPRFTLMAQLGLDQH